MSGHNKNLRRGMKRSGRPRMKNADDYTPFDEPESGTPDLFACRACGELLKEDSEGYVKHECTVKCARCGHSMCPYCGDWCDNIVNCPCLEAMACEPIKVPVCKLCGMTPHEIAGGACASMTDGQHKMVPMTLSERNELYRKLYPNTKR